MIYRDGAKRMLDGVGAGVLLVLVSPLLLLGIVAVRLSSPGPLFFRQKRVGFAQQPFTILKLRTMHVDEERSPGQTRGGDPGVFPAGRLLRRFKIDEMPQLLNVLMGDMSLIGPRPCLAESLGEMPEWAKERFAVRPGLTGLAQVRGNIELSWPERWRYDVRYVRDCSFRLDAAIAAATVLVVLFGEKLFLRVP